MNDELPPVSEASTAALIGRISGSSNTGEVVHARRRWLWRGGWLLLFLSIFGIAGWRYLVQPVREGVRLRLSLASFGRLYNAFQQERLHSPRDIDELEAFVQSQSTGRLAQDCQTAQIALKMAREGRLKVIWNAIPTNWKNPGEYLACEPAALVDVGYVLWTNTSAERLDAMEFARRGVPATTMGP